jgi:hypothetical protein
MRLAIARPKSSSGTRAGRIATLTAALSAGLLAIATSASASTTVTVTEANLGDGNNGTWTTADTRTGGAIGFVNDYGAPAGLGGGALLLTTDDTDAAKAQLLTYTSMPLSEVTQLGYWTYRSTTSTGFSAGLPSFQLLVDVDGTVGDGTGFTTLVYEPYNVYGNGAVQTGVWQQWDVAAGTFWSSKSVNGLTAGFGGAPFYSIDDVLAKNPNAVVLGFGVNVGSYNPDYITAVDGVTVNGTTYNFEPRVFSADDCKSGGWAVNFTSGRFVNQGDCVSYFASNGATHPKE